MAAEKQSIALGYGNPNLTELVDKELKNIELSDAEKHKLNSDVQAWRNELIQCKRRIEMQFTSLKTTAFSDYACFMNGEITYHDYVQRLNTVKLKRVHAARFLQQVETRMQQLRS